MRLPALPLRLRGTIAFWALAGIALLVSHDAVFLAQMGPGESLVRALRSAGHGYWGAASVILALIGLGAGVGVAGRLLRLHLRARRIAARQDSGRPPFMTRLLVAWGRLFAVVAIGFVVQESAEHLAMHGHAIGVGALIGPEYPLALPVIGLISLLGAAAAIVISRHEAVLLATIAATLRRLHRRAPRTLQRPPLRLAAPRASLMAHAEAGRGPPGMLASGT